jgi:hypothetical protein
MKVRRLLQHLDKLRHQARVSFLHAFFQVKLCRRRVTQPLSNILPAHDAGADMLLSEEGRIFRLLCSDTVELTTAYQDWIAPLAQLPAGATPAQIRSILTGLTGAQPTRDSVGKFRFSWREYKRSIPAALSQAVEFVQFGHAIRQPALNLLSVLDAGESSQKQESSPAVLLIHCQSRRRETSGETNLGRF